VAGIVRQVVRAEFPQELGGTGNAVPQTEPHIAHEAGDSTETVPERVPHRLLRSLLRFRADDGCGPVAGFVELSTGPTENLVSRPAQGLARIGEDRHRSGRAGPGLRLGVGGRLLVGVAGVLGGRHPLVPQPDGFGCLALCPAQRVRIAGDGHGGDLEGVRRLEPAARLAAEPVAEGVTCGTRPRPAVDRS
jgi:hypothetical protein